MSKPVLFCNCKAIFMTGEIFEAGDQLVYSFGDWEGFGFHGDFLHGWKDNVIQNAIDYCTDNDDGLENQCKIFKSSRDDCPWEGTEDDSKYKGVLDNLPPKM